MSVVFLFLIQEKVRIDLYQKQKRSAFKKLTSTARYIKVVPVQ